MRKLRHVLAAVIIGVCFSGVNVISASAAPHHSGDCTDLSDHGVGNSGDPGNGGNHHNESNGVGNIGDPGNAGGKACSTDD